MDDSKYFTSPKINLPAVPADDKKKDYIQPRNLQKLEEYVRANGIDATVQKDYLSLIEVRDIPEQHRDIILDGDKFRNPLFIATAVAVALDALDSTSNAKEQFKYLIGGCGVSPKRRRDFLYHSCVEPLLHTTPNPGLPYPEFRKKMMRDVGNAAIAIFYRVRESKDRLVKPEAGA